MPDHEAKEICAAVVRLNPEQYKAQRHTYQQIDLKRIRRDMNESLPKYMLPVLVKVLGSGEEMPQTVSQKPIKSQIIQKYFGVKSWSSENSILGVEYLGSMPTPVEADTKLWDWLGLQRADFKSWS